MENFPKDNSTPNLESGPAGESYIVDSLSAENAVNTNNIEPLVDTDGHRRVALNRIVGMDRLYFKDGIKISPRDASLGFKHYEELFYEAAESSEGVIEMTPEQKEIVNMIVEEIPDFLKQYGLEKPVLVPTSAIRISDMSGLNDDDRKKASSTTAFWSGEEQRIVFNGDIIESKSNLEFAHILAHELIHLHSFHSLELAEHKDNQGEVTRRSIRARKSGLVNLTAEVDADGEEFLLDNFAQINEALTESLAQHFTNMFLDRIPHTRQDIEETRRELESIYKDRKGKTPEKQIYVEDAITGLTYGDESSGKDFIKVVRDSGSYGREIDILKSTVNLTFSKARLYQESMRQAGQIKLQNSLHNLLMSFHEEFDVTKFLTRTYFSGKQLDFARLSKFVSGKSFREIGEMTNLVRERESEKSN